MTKTTHPASSGIFTAATAGGDLSLPFLAFEGARDGIVVAGPDGRILAVNPGFCRLTGCGPEEPVGQHLGVMLGAGKAGGTLQEVWDAVEAAGSWQGGRWVQRKSGESYLEWLTINAVATADGPIHYVGVFSDVTALRQAQDLEHLGNHDVLTGLPRRQLLKSRLEHSLQRSERQEGKGAVMCLGLDGFRDVVGRLGRPAGDDLLVQVALRLKERLRSMDTVARLGADEFAVVLEEIPDGETAERLARSFIERLAEPFALEGAGQVELGLSVGVALYPADGYKAEQLIRRAGAALKLARAQGRGAVSFHNPAALTPPAA